MNYRGLGCPDCRKVTSGDCGRHGPTAIILDVSPGGATVVTDEVSRDRAMQDVVDAWRANDEKRLALAIARIEMILKGRP